MLKDFLLASLHHLLAFGLVAMLVTQSVLLSRTIDGATIRRLGGVDRGYGIVASLLLIVSLTRVFHGIKGADFYLHNPWFHAKFGAFLLPPCASCAGARRSRPTPPGSRPHPKPPPCAASSASN
jgi:putative membrane protein